MIPIVWLPALVIGRWWTIPLAAIGWPLLLLITGSLDFGAVPVAAGLAAANAAVMVLIRWLLRVTFASRFASPS
jgi:hypothetical protein